MHNIFLQKSNRYIWVNEATGKQSSNTRNGSILADKVHKQEPQCKWLRFIQPYPYISSSGMVDSATLFYCYLCRDMHGCVKHSHLCCGSCKCTLSAIILPFLECELSLPACIFIHPSLHLFDFCKKYILIVYVLFQPASIKIVTRCCPRTCGWCIILAG